MDGIDFVLRSHISVVHVFLPKLAVAFRIAKRGSYRKRRRIYVMAVLRKASIHIQQSHGPTKPISCDIPMSLSRIFG